MNTKIDPNVLIILAALVLVYIIYRTKIIQFFMLARFSNINISLWDLILIKIRRVDIETIVTSMITLDKERIKISTFNLETHYLAGGNLGNVCKGLLYSKRNNLEIDFKVAAEADLKKMDLIKAIDQWKLNHPDEKVIVRL